MPEKQLILVAWPYLSIFLCAIEMATLDLCLACGESAVEKDRRVLGGSGNTSEQVTLLWKRIFLKELDKRSEQLHFDLDGLIHQQRSYICRKCYYAYDKLCETEKVPF